MKYLSGIVLGVIVVGLCACSGSSRTITTSTKLTSSTLSVNALRLKKTISSDCGNEMTHCLTPSGVTGTVYYGGVMVGDTSGYSLGPIIGDVTDPSTVVSFAATDLQDFDLAQELEVGGGIVCCGGSPYPQDDQAVVSRIEIYFGYIDTTFALSADDGVNDALIGTHAIRTVFADIDDTEMRKGDLLYKGSSDEDFMWCTSDEGCTLTSRPSNPIQNASILNYAGSPDGLGNQTIPTFAANLAEGHDTITITETQVLNNSFLFTIDFDMTDAVGFTEDITAKEDIAQMVGVFQLDAEPGSSDSGFTTTVSVEMTPLESPRTSPGDEEGTE